MHYAAPAFKSEGTVEGYRGDVILLDILMILILVFNIVFDICKYLYRAYVIVLLFHYCYEIHSSSIMRYHIMSLLYI